MNILLVTSRRLLAPVALVVVDEPVAVSVGAEVFDDTLLQTGDEMGETSGFDDIVAEKLAEASK